MSTPHQMFSVGDMLRPEFARSWHEAVAVVQEVAAILTPGLGVPAPQDLVFDESGSLSLGFASEGGGNEVTALALLLQGLLDGTEAPVGLTQLAAENAVPAPAHATLDGFARALAFYERPNRRNDLAAVASRLYAAGGTRQSDEEFARLREKVAAKAEDHERAASPEGAKKRDKRATGRQKAMLAGAVAALLLVVALGFSRGNAAGAADTAELHLAGFISSILERLGFGTPTAAEMLNPEAAGDTPAAATGGRAEAEPAPAVRTTSAVPPVARARAPRRDIDLPVVIAEDGPGEPLDGPVPIIEFATGRPLDAPEIAPGDISVYSAANGDVKPPAFQRPQLPREPRPGEDTGYFDILVSEQGMVEQVRLISPTGRFQERMLVAAAKAWRFEPARLDGQPVRYRMRIPIILKGLP